MFHSRICTLNEMQFNGKHFSKWRRYRSLASRYLFFFRVGVRTPLTFSSCQSTDKIVLDGFAEYSIAISILLVVLSLRVPPLSFSVIMPLNSARPPRILKLRLSLSARCRRRPLLPSPPPHCSAMSFFSPCPSVRCRIFVCVFLCVESPESFARALNF